MVKQKRYVYETKTKKWSLIGEGELDYGFGISQLKFKKQSRKKSLKEYLSPF